jgi:hypothetical protein
MYAALITVGEFLVPVSLLIPSETGSWSVKAISFLWQVAQLTSPVELNRLSLKSLSPNAIFSGVWGLSAGMGTSGSPSGGAATTGTLMKNSIIIPVYKA